MLLVLQDHTTEGITSGVHIQLSSLCHKYIHQLSATVSNMFIIVTMPLVHTEEQGSSLAQLYRLTELLYNILYTYDNKYKQ